MRRAGGGRKGAGAKGAHLRFASRCRVRCPSAILRTWKSDSRRSWLTASAASSASSASDSGPSTERSACTTKRSGRQSCSSLSGVRGQSDSETPATRERARATRGSDALSRRQRRSMTSTSDARHVVAGLPGVRANEDNPMFGARPRGVGAGREIEGLDVLERVGESEASAQGFCVVEHTRRVPPGVGGVAVRRGERRHLDAERAEVLDQRLDMLTERR